MWNIPRLIHLYNFSQGAPRQSANATTISRERKSYSPILFASPNGTTQDDASTLLTSPQNPYTRRSSHAQETSLWKQTITYMKPGPTRKLVSSSTCSRSSLGRSEVISQRNRIYSTNTRPRSPTTPQVHFSKTSNSTRRVDWDLIV